MPTPFEHFRVIRFFGSLDGLRAIAILLVVWFHAGHDGWGFLGKGFFGVELFFVISGFLITTLLLREEERTGQVSLRNFYIRRSLRIFPLYYAVLFVYVLIVSLIERDTTAKDVFWRNLPAYATYTSNWLVNLTAHDRVIFYFAWSLATEEQFYLFWPSVIRYTKRFATPAVVMLVLLVADQLLELVLFPQWFADHPTGRQFATSLATPICLGCLLAYAAHRPWTFALLYRVLGHCWSAPLCLVLTALAIQFESCPPLLVHVAMTGLVGACCIRDDNGLWRILSWRPVAYIGTISYGIYLIHMLCLNIAQRVPGVKGHSMWVFLVGLLISITIASLSYRFFEKPFLRIKACFATPA